MKYETVQAYQTKLERIGIVLFPFKEAPTSGDILTHEEFKLFEPDMRVFPSHNSHAPLFHFRWVEERRLWEFESCEGPTN